MKLRIAFLLLYAALPAPAQDSRQGRRVIDAHGHVGMPGDSLDLAKTVDLAIRVMDANGITATVDFSGGSGEPLKKKIAFYNERYPGRFVACVNIPWNRIDEPQFSKLALGIVETAYKDGARCVKVFKSLGLGARDSSGRLVRIDDPRADAVWGKAGALRIPVFIHSGDPAAFFRPPTPDNERYAELGVHPEWSFYGEKWPAREEILGQLLRVVAHHPETDFVGLHFGNNPEDLRWVARVMDRFPNYHLDLGARVGEIGRHNPDELRALIVRYQDRVTFGSDTAYSGDHLTLGVPEPRSKTIEESREFFRRHWEFFETNHRGIEHPSPIQGNWKVNAIGLPPPVLRKIYRENAMRLVPGLK